MIELESCLRFLSQADEIRHSHPRRSLELALDARDVAAVLDRKAVGVIRWRSLQADAWAILGSSYRAVGDLRRAENAFNVAFSFLAERPLYDPLALSRLCQRAAYLRSDQGRFPEALDLIDSAIADFRQLGENGRLACALVDRGVILRGAGLVREALSYVRQALEILDTAAEPRIFLAASHNMALYLQELAETPAELQEAIAWLEVAIAQHGRAAESVDFFKTRAVVALTSIRLGRREEGRAELQRCFEGFGRLDSIPNQAVMLLHLLALAAMAGQQDEIQRLTGLFFPLLHRLDPQEAIGNALLDLIKLVQRQAAGAEGGAEALARHLGGRTPARPVAESSR